MNTPSPVYDLQFFRSFFAGIPDDKWCVGTRTNYRGQRCALGHLSPVENAFKDTPMTQALNELFLDGIRMYPAYVNNGFYVSYYPQSTPKARILAAIDDLIAMDEAKRDAALDAVELRPLISVDKVVVAPTEQTRELVETLT